MVQNGFQNNGINDFNMYQM
jgi:hypothetical protein